MAPESPAPRGRLVGLDGFEPSTPRLSSVCSNQLSYRPPIEESGHGVLVAAMPPQRSPRIADRTQTTTTADKCERKIFEHFSRKEVIQPHLPIRLPCYDFTPVMKLTVVGALLAVRQPASGEPHSHGVTGGVYKARERIHRDMLIRDY
jgi:hypothetical protein